MTSSRHEGHDLPAQREAAVSGSMAPEGRAEPAASPSADERWLLRWLPLVREHAPDRCVLELGCGKGRDTRVLQRAGLARPQ